MLKERKDLQWLIDSGADEAIAESTTNRFATPQSQPKPQENNKDQIPQNNDQNETPQTNQVQPSGIQDAINESKKLADCCTTIDELAEKIESFESCSLKNTAKNTVYYRGTQTPDILCVGLSPNKNDEQEKTPFSGDLQTLTNRMFSAINCDLDKIAYTNSVFWYPPGDRTITENEFAVNKAFLLKTIEIANPKILIVFGNELAKYLFNETASKLRGKELNLELNQNIKSFVLYSAKQMFNVPTYKKQVWNDLKKLSKHINND